VDLKEDTDSNKILGGFKSALSAMGLSSKQNLTKDLTELNYILDQMDLRSI
jgi:hypothetical protein